MHFLLLKIASSVGMGLVLKHADARGIDRLAVIRVNYAAGAVIAFFAAVALGQKTLALNTALLAAVLGVLFVAGLVFWAKAIETGGLATSVVAMRTAIVIPVLASVVCWRETPGVLEIAGAVVALVALGLVIAEIVRPARRVPPPGERPTGRHAWGWMLGVFLVNGLVNTGAKLFQQEMPQEQSFPFQATIFVSAFLVTTVLYYVRKARVDRSSLLYGSALGAANLGNYLFLILALNVLPGTVVYPATAAGEVGLMALAGLLVWGERLGVRGWVGIALAVVALVLLQVG
ncbi:MAG: EamA family transporter [candidate division WOR-3 bacterium]|nr:MAG: EamA family transporter [candidate division WOR-3 bacterium]